MAQLQMLSAENEMLKLRAAVLEATVANREDQVSAGGGLLTHRLQYGIEELLAPAGGSKAA